MSTNPAPAEAQAPPLAVLSLMPVVFVLLWSTGFLGMRLGAPYAEPFTFMLWRMGLVVALLFAAAMVLRAPWPASRGEAGHIALAGLLTHATYLCGVLIAIQKGLPLGYVALIAGLQPVLTALIATGFLGERLRALQWAGLALGCAGVLLVVAGKTGHAAVNAAAILSATAGLLGITFGTLYQKKFCAGMHLVTGGIVQFTATGLVLAVLAFAFETRTVHWTGEFVFALFWLAIVLSLGAITLLNLIIRRGAASQVASLFFLTPSVTAVLAWLLFDEAMPVLAIAGMAVTAIGVALVTRGPAQNTSS
ncbi:MAG: DMT family transporter [Betaproteobacteria bacterium]|nr:DMT family transporter [Betaproteobacteria bacterium]